MGFIFRQSCGLKVCNFTKTSINNIFLNKFIQGFSKVFHLHLLLPVNIFYLGKFIPQENILVEAAN